MRKLIVLEYITLDGVIQAAGGSQEDTLEGFKYGGWQGPYFDDFLDKVMGEQMREPLDLLLGRKTYDIFAGYWPHHEIAWTWVKYVRGHSSDKQQIGLLKYVGSLLPSAAPDFVVGDSEFASILVLRQLEQWHWFYVLRQKGKTGLWHNEQIGWQRMDDLVQHAGQSTWCPNAYVTR